MLTKTQSVLLSGFKYVYLIAFFALLSGFFHPLITDTGFESVIIGVAILFVGLAGGILLYKSATSENKRLLFLIGGFVLIAVSLLYVYRIILGI